MSPGGQNCKRFIDTSEISLFCASICICLSKMSTRTCLTISLVVVLNFSSSITFGSYCGHEHINYKPILPAGTLPIKLHECLWPIIVIPIPIFNRSYVKSSYVDGHNGLYDHSLDVYHEKDGFYECPSVIIGQFTKQLEFLTLKNVKSGLYNRMLTDHLNVSIKRSNLNKHKLYRKIPLAIRDYRYICFNYVRSMMEEVQLKLLLFSLIFFTFFILSCGYC